MSRASGSQPAVTEIMSEAIGVPSFPSFCTSVMFLTRPRRDLFRFLAASLVAAYFSPVLQGQMSPACHVMEMKDQTPPEQLPPPQWMNGTGNAHIPVTATPDAQRWFDQGLNLRHDFWDYESARAFEQAVRIDPQCAMCYWGLYEAESFYHSLAKDYATEALNKAKALANHVTERERLYIEATAAEPSKAIALWRELVQKYPDDMQAKLFLSMTVHHDEQLNILRSILKEKPDDSAANHYFIHAVEASDHPEQALHSADILASLAPASGHMVHMPGHIYFRIGDYSRAEQAFAASMAVDEHYIQEQHVDPDNDWNYVHNLMYAVANLLEEGKLAEATSLSGKLSGARGALESTLYVYSVRDSISRLNPRLPVAVRAGDWVEVHSLLHARSPQANHPNLEFLALELDRFAAAMEAVQQHRLRRARHSSAEFDTGLRRRRAASDIAEHAPSHKLEVMPDALLKPILSMLTVMSSELRATIAARKGNIKDARNLFADAEREEKALGYREPPYYIRPAAETEGAAMLSAKQWGSALKAYKRALLDRPKSGWALYGVALSEQESGDQNAAAETYSEFLTAWKNADPDLPQLKHARAFTARSNNSAPS